MMLLKVGDFICIPLVQGESYRGGYSSFFFTPEQLDRRRAKLGIFIVYGYHIDVYAGVNGKLVRDGGS